MRDKTIIRLGFDELFTEVNTSKIFEFFKNDPSDEVEIVVNVPISVINNDRVVGMKDYTGTSIPVSMKLNYHLIMIKALDNVGKEYSDDDVINKACQYALESQCDVVKNLFVIH